MRSLVVLEYGWKGQPSAAEEPAVDWSQRTVLLCLCVTSSWDIFLPASCLSTCRVGWGLKLLINVKAFLQMVFVIFHHPSKIKCYSQGVRGFKKLIMGFCFCLCLDFSVFNRGCGTCTLPFNPLNY